MTIPRRFSLRGAPAPKRLESLRVTLARSKARIALPDADTPSMRKLAVAFLTRAIGATIKRDPYFSRGTAVPRLDDFVGTNDQFEDARRDARDATKASVSIDVTGLLAKRQLLGL